MKFDIITALGKRVVSMSFLPDKEEPIYSVGTNAYRIDRILSV